MKPLVHLQDQMIVVFFDICSSTTILEDLTTSQSTGRWKNLLGAVKTHLSTERATYEFIVYKFLGDGWILLFPLRSTTGDMVLTFLAELDAHYCHLFHEKIEPVMQQSLTHIGITAGVDIGPLIETRMNDTDEFIGRALNVAARLQDSIKQKDDRPAGKALFSQPAFTKLGISSSAYRSFRVTRTLRNISGGERYKARKVLLKK